MKTIKKVFLFALLLITLSTFSIVFAAVNSNKQVHNPPVPKIKQNIVFTHPADLNNASGVIIALNASSITLTLSGHKNDKITQTKTINFNSKTTVNKDLATIKITDLKVGDTVRVILELMPNKTYLARSIRVMTAKTGDIIKQIRAKEPKI